MLKLFFFWQGEQECSYYVRTGHCKFGATCKFHHPEPVGMQGSMPQPQPQVPQIPAAVHPHTLYQSIQTPAVPSSQPYGVVVRPTYFPGHYVGSYGPALLPPGMVPFPSWAPYPVGKFENFELSLSILVWCTFIFFILIL